MNMSIARALLLDALYQILDNKVFRLLVILVMIPIAFSFLVGFREDEIVFFFGVRTFEYSVFLNPASTSAGDGTLRIQAIQTVQRILVENLSGDIGVLFCIAATAFFIPRMLERGTADTLFSKPLSRGTLLFARYVSGVLFVFLLSSVLILGVHAGLTLVSGYSDPGFLWGILTLTYLFALVHSVSTFVATLTRSSTAAILCTLVFFTGTGCTHKFWLQKEHKLEREESAESTEAEDLLANGNEARSSGVQDSFVEFLITTLDIAHYTLPKTTDADALTSLLRRSLEGSPKAIEDETGGLRIGGPPTFGESCKVVREVTDAPAKSQHFDIAWKVSDSDGKQLATIKIERLHRRHETLPDGSQGARLEKALSSRNHSRTRPGEIMEFDGVSAVEAVRGRVANRSTSFVRWSETKDGTRQHHEEILFGYREHFYQIASRWDSGWLTEDERELFMQAFLDGLSFPELEESLEQDNVIWFKNRLSLSGPLKFNILFSIGSSVAFACSMLFFAWLALRRINF